MFKFWLNPLDRLLKKARRAGQKRFLICWNRGLGDIPLGLYALTERIYASIPDAAITFATRIDLAEGFTMLPKVTTLVDPDWKRGTAFDLDATLKKCGWDRSHFDVILERPDPSRWLLWQLGKVTPRLYWDPTWDAHAERFDLSKEKKYIGVHVQTETQYAYEKNWPLEHWRAFFQRIVSEKQMEILLFGFHPTPSFEGPGIHDMRGKTSLFDMLSLIKNRCQFLVVPDSGILSMTYYIDAPFSIDIISLWADPEQGVLKQNVASPNPLLRHRPLIAEEKDLRRLSVDAVLQELL